MPDAGRLLQPVPSHASRRRRPSRVEVVVAAGGVLVLCAVAFLVSRAATVEKDHQAMARASADLKAHVILGHLWFEEAIMGDPEVDLVTDVYGNLDRSLELCRDMRDGGRSSSGTPKATAGGDERANLTLLCRRLASFRDLTAERWLNREASGPGSPQEGAYDRLFEEIVGRSDRGAAAMEQLMDDARSFQDRLATGTVLALTALLAGVMAVLGRYQRVVEAKNAELAGLASIVESSEDAIIGTDLDGVIVTWNCGAERLYGYAAGEAVGHPASMLLPPESPDEVRHNLERVRRAERAGPYEAVRVAKDGRRLDVWLAVSPVRSSDGEITGAASIARDITDRKRAEEALSRQALYDPLTGLANRALFRDRLAHGLHGALAGGGEPAVLVIDLDGFKEVNEILGHGAGDQLLVEVAARVQACVGPADTTARLGGDEFAVLLAGGGASAAEKTAARITAACRRPAGLADREVLPFASVGVAVCEPGQEVEDVLRNADAAMYAAKAGGGNHHQVYQAGAHDKLRGRLELAADLRGAVERGEFTLRYQPIVVTGTGRIVGMEALVRWNHPRRGLVSPADFVPVAEATGTIGALGRWVLETACLQMAAWQERYPTSPALYMSVNVATSQLRDAGLAAEVSRLVSRCGLSPGSLVLEVTETSLVADFDETIGTLHRLKELGVKLSIDDFGTGYSSLTYLRRLPVDVVKIDRSFVQGIATDANEWALAVAVIRLVKALGLQTVAEGVEGAPQLAHLRALGCEFAQGYYFAKPQDVEGMEALLAEAGAVPTSAGSGVAVGTRSAPSPLELADGGSPH